MTTQGESGRSLPECDVIMKGGISSGIVYPRAVCKLAEKYKLRRLGGASAGAIAAAIAAAAEYGRDRGGYQKLHAVPTELGSTLADLFQPSRGTSSAFAVLSSWLEPDWPIRRKLRAAWQTIVRCTAWAFTGTLVALLVPALLITLISRGLPSDLGGWLGVVLTGLVWAPLALILATAVSAVVFGRRSLASLKANGYGLCDGHTEDPAVGKPPLTDWLAAKLDEIAGLPAGRHPLTIGDLWGDQAVELERAIAEKKNGRVMPEERLAARTARQIELEVMTTNLTLRRPYRFPFSERIFFFCEQRLRDYFPDRVVAHLVEHSTPVDDKTDSQDGETATVSMKCPCHEQQVRRLPAAWDLPVVVAARLSLSFPGLISAVPMFCVDWSRAFGRRGLVEVWFSDGGISSNFPMHFFDAAWPSRPTFGINLGSPHPDLPGLVWRASQGASGVLPPVHPIGSASSFLTAIVRTMQNWVDTTQLTLPGFRGRVAVVREQAGEGGMNLKMKPEVIEDVADRGAEAAALFDDFDFDLHRWVRYRVAMSEFDEVLTTLNDAYLKGYQDFLKEYGVTTKNYPVGGKAVTGAELALTDALMKHAHSAASQSHPAGAGTVPHPRPAFRLVPRQ